MHMCYGFDLLSSKAEAKYIRNAVEEFEAVGKAGWICWALSNHDVTRAATRWNMPEQSMEFAPLSLALLCSLRGSQCLYQGEELGLTEADLPFEVLQDPYGIAFWPEMKGRDGCRTPMPWGDGVRGGFTTSSRPWLPIPPEHRKRAVSRQLGRAGSSLERTKQFLHWRKTQDLLIDGDIVFHDAEEPVLAFSRILGNRAMICVFNVSAAPAQYNLTVQATALEGQGFLATLSGQTLNLPKYGAFFGVYHL